MAENIFLKGIVAPDTYTRIVDLVWKTIKDANEKEAIKVLINEYLGVEKKTFLEQSTGVDFDFIFDSLPGIILSALFDKDVLLHIYDVQDGHDDIEIKKLCNKCIADSGAKSETSKEKVRIIVCHCIEIVKAYRLKKMTGAELARDKRLADGINEHTSAELEAQKKEYKAQEAKKEAKMDRLEDKLNEVCEGVASLEKKIDTNNAANIYVAPSRSSGISSTETVSTINFSNKPNYAKKAVKLNQVLSWKLSNDELNAPLADLKKLADILNDIPKMTRRILARIVLLANYDEWDRFYFTGEALKEYFPYTDLAGPTDILERYEIISPFDQSDYEYYGRDIRSLCSNNPDWNYWYDIKMFCKAEGIDIERIIVDLDFSVFD